MPRTKEGCERGKLIKDIRNCFGVKDDFNAVVNSLVEELYWQIIKLRECREKLDKSDISLSYENGRQSCMIQNPILKTYNDLIKNQSTTIKSLCSLTGKKSEDGNKEGLKQMLAFLNKDRK